MSKVHSYTLICTRNVGVAWMFVTNALFEYYNILVIDRRVDGIQCLLLVHMISNFSVNCYLATQ